MDVRLKVFCIGDPHFTIKDISSGEKFLVSCVNAAKDASPDIIVCMGDILHHHRNIDSVVLTLATEFCRQLSLIAPFYLLMGNHDLLNGLEFQSVYHGFNALKLWPQTFVVDKTLVSVVKGHKFIFVPYAPPGRFYEALNLSGVDWKFGISTIFAHQELYGCKEGGTTSINGDKWVDTYPVVVSGHIHQAQRVGTNILYVGIPYEHEFLNLGSEDRKSVWLIHYLNYQIEKFDRIDLLLPGKKKLVVTSIDELDKVEGGGERNEICIEVDADKSELIGFDERLPVKQARERGIKVNKKEVAKKSNTVLGDALKKGYAYALYHSIDQDLKEIFVEVIGKV